MRNVSLKYKVFEKEVNFNEPDFKASRNQASESTQLRVNRFFFLSSLSRNFDDQLSSNFSQVCYFIHMLTLHQLRRLVFDNNQKCPVFLKTTKYLEQTAKSSTQGSSPVLTCYFTVGSSPSTRTLTCVSSASRRTYTSIAGMRGARI